MSLYGEAIFFPLFGFIFHAFCFCLDLCLLGSSVQEWGGGRSYCAWQGGSGDQPCDLIRPIGKPVGDSHKIIF